MDHKLFALPPTERMIVLGAILLVFLIVRGSQFFSAKKTTRIPLGASRDYGMAGGAVCPKCHRPIRLGLVSLKLGLGTKLVRCEFCGKWSVVRRLNFEELRAAEAAELAEAQPLQPVPEKSEEEKTKELAEKSRFYGE